MWIDNAWVQLAIMAFTGWCSLNLIRILARASTHTVQVWVPRPNTGPQGEPTPAVPVPEPGRNQGIVEVAAQEVAPEQSPLRLATFEDIESQSS